MGVRVHIGRLNGFGKAGYGLLVKTGLIGEGTNTQIDDAGLVVSQSGVERVRVGDISGGAGTNYGISIKDSAGNAIIDGSKVQLSRSEGTIPAGVALGIQQTTVTSSGLKVTTGGSDRLIAGDIGGGVYGLKVVSTDGVTTIIDGTTNVFKILTSGSVSVTVPARSTNAVAAANTEVTLTSLGTFSTIPAHLSFVGPSVATTDSRKLGWGNVFNTVAMVSNQADGATGINFLGLYSQASMSTRLNASSQVLVRIGGENANSSTGYTREGLYHILKEAAL